MKKSILLLIICTFTSVLLYGQEHEFEYITEDIFYHKPFLFEPSQYDRFYTGKDGSKLHYEGWIDSTGTPRCFGKIVEGINNTLLSGQIKNGQFDGWCSSREIGFDGIMKWQDSSKTVVPVGWGHSSIPFSYVADQSQSYGLALVGSHTQYTTPKAKYLSSGEWYNVVDAYSKILYDNQKNNIKIICSKRNLKYVEDVKLGIITYSGGWKDGEPYSYGAYKSPYFVFCGHFKYTPKDYVFEPDNNGSWTKIDSGDQYGHDYEPVFHQHTIVSSPNEENHVEDVKLWTWNSRREKTISDAKGNILEFEDFRFKDGAYVFGKRENSNEPLWGYIIGRYDFYEGMILSSSSYGKTIHANGHMMDNTLGGDKKLIKYANGDVLLIDRTIDRGWLVVGDYTFADGAYIVGIFKHPNNEWDQQGFVPVYADSYDKDNIIIKSYVDTQNGTIKAEEAEAFITQLKKEHNIPMNGFGTKIGDNYTYKGEFKARRYHGKGKITYNDGTYNDGVWKNGKFVEGKAFYKNDNGQYIGELKGTSPHGKGKFIYNDSTFKEGIWKNGKFVEGNLFFKNSKGAYVGESKNGQPHGVGKFSCNNGAYFDGIFEDGAFKSGKGYKVFGDSAIFEGHWEYFMAKGGTFTLKDGTKVVRTWEVENNGESSSSSLNEHVEVFYTNKSEYHGPCISNLLEGDSVLIVDSIGNRYIGGWNQNGRYGRGVENFSNGDSLVSTWSNNAYVQDAKFIYVWNDGRRCEGSIGKKGKVRTEVFTDRDGSIASKKEYKNWIMQIPSIVDIHIIPVTITHVSATCD